MPIDRKCHQNLIHCNLQVRLKVLSLPTTLKPSRHISSTFNAGAVVHDGRARHNDLSFGEFLFTSYVFVLWHLSTAEDFQRFSSSSSRHGSLSSSYYGDSSSSRYGNSCLRLSISVIGNTDRLPKSICSVCLRLSMVVVDCLGGWVTGISTEI